jgi:hypothetical protein
VTYRTPTSWTAAAKVYIETKQKTGSTTRNAGKGIYGPNFSSVILFASLALWKPLKKIPNLQLCGTHRDSSKRWSKISRGKKPVWQSGIGGA